MPKPNMHKFYDGRNVATRPIPIIVYESERRAIAAAAADQRPKSQAVNLPQGPRVGGAGVLFGTPVAGSTKISGNTFNPGSGENSII